ncbi:hypothetical protein ES708_17900 [subsurface metagenome]
MEKPYRIEKKLVKIGGSDYIAIPAAWLKKLAKKCNLKVIQGLDLLIYRNYLVLKPSK